MPQLIDLVLRGGRIATPGGLIEADLAIVEGRIAAVGAPGRPGRARGAAVAGLTVLPGVIDPRCTSASPG